MSRPTCFARTEFPRASPNISVILRAGTSGVVVTIIDGVLFVSNVRCFSAQSSVPLGCRLTNISGSYIAGCIHIVKGMRSVSSLCVTYWIQGFVNLRRDVTSRMQRRLN